MTKVGNIISVEANELRGALDELMDAVQNDSALVRILRDGQPVAEIRSTGGAVDPLKQHAALKATYVAEDAFSPASDDEWPEDCR